MGERTFGEETAFFRRLGQSLAFRCISVWVFCLHIFGVKTLLAARKGTPKRESISGGKTAALRGSECGSLHPGVARFPSCVLEKREFKSAHRVRILVLHSWTVICHIDVPSDF